LSTNVGTPTQVFPGQGIGALFDFRIIPRVETYKVVTDFAQTIPGKLLILSLFALGLRFADNHWLVLSVCLAVTTFVPERRRLVVTLATLAFAFVLPWPTWQRPLVTSTLVLSALATGGLLFWLSSRFPKSLLGRRPILTLLTGYVLLIAAAISLPQTSRFYVAGWGYTYFLGTYIWFIGYSLLDRRAPGHDGFGLQLGTYRPFWGSSNTPFVKGAAYLRRIEARDDQQLAVCQIKGLKLLAWSLLISLFAKYFSQFVHGYLAIPTFQDALLRSVRHLPEPWHVCWASLVCAFLEAAFGLAIGGHRIVACVRMAGFHALRNTYRPLSSPTISEFWNRYYFYFKELLVDFFFYPVFLIFPKIPKKLRLVLATFAAAGFGNAFYHFIRDLHFIYEKGFWNALVGYQVYLFYCFVLAAAIAVSQLRPRRPAPVGFFRARVVPCFCVVLFFCLLHIFDDETRVYPIQEHFRFLAHLFNLNI
jgi:hypothetical protein